MTLHTYRLHLVRIPQNVNSQVKFLASSCLCLGHYIENTGNTTLKILEILKSSMCSKNTIWMKMRFLNGWLLCRSLRRYFPNPMACAHTTWTGQSSFRLLWRDYSPPEQDEANACEMKAIGQTFFIDCSRLPAIRSDSTNTEELTYHKNSVSFSSVFYFCSDLFSFSFSHSHLSSFTAFTIISQSPLRW